jgi:Aspartyl/Asparaginyl beta-hydroxylase
MLTEGAIATDMFARFVGSITDEQMSRLRCMVKVAPWRDVPGRSYDTADVGFWEPCNRAFLIRIYPGGSIPKHHDSFITGETHHFVIQSNDQCWNWWIDSLGIERKVQMTQGNRYSVSRTPLHWAENNGDADRIHLLVEF